MKKTNLVCILYTSCRGIWYHSLTTTASSATATSIKCNERKMRGDTTRVTYITFVVRSMDWIAAKINEEEATIYFVWCISRSAWQTGVPIAYEYACFVHFEYWDILTKCSKCKIIWYAFAQVACTEATCRIASVVNFCRFGLWFSSLYKSLHRL